MSTSIDQQYLNAAQNIKDQILTIYKAATGTGPADVPGGIPPNVSNVVTNTVQFINPLNSLINPTPWRGEKTGWGGVTMTLPRLTSIRSPGSYGGTKSEGRYGQTVLDKEDINIKKRISRFKIWNLLKLAGEGYIDPLATQLNGEATAMGLDFALSLMYDNSNTLYSATDTAFGAFERSIFKSWQTNRLDLASSATGKPTVMTDLTYFERLYVANLTANGETHRKAWFMSPAMAARVSTFDQGASNIFRLVQNIDSQPGGPSDGSGSPIEVHLGRWPKTLFNIPIYVSTLMGGGVNQGTTLDTMGTITLTTSATGGSMSNTISGSPIYVKVAKVVRKFNLLSDSYLGLTQASAASNVAITAGGSTNKVTVTFSADTDALWYAAYACTTGLDQDYRLVAFVPGNTYDSDGEWTANVTSFDIGTITPDTDPTSSTYGIPTQGVVGKMYLDHPPIPSAAGYNSEQVYLIDLDETQGWGGYKYLDESADEIYGFCTLRDVTPSNKADAREWMLYSYGSPLGRYERTCGILTNVAVQ